MRFTAAISLLLLPLAALASPIAQPTLAPLEATSGDHIDDAYIIVFKKGVDVNQIALHIGQVQELHAANVSIPISSLPLDVELRPKATIPSRASSRTLPVE